MIRVVVHLYLPELFCRSVLVDLVMSVHDLYAVESKLAAKVDDKVSLGSIWSNPVTFITSLFLTMCEDVVHMKIGWIMMISVDVTRNNTLLSAT